MWKQLWKSFIYSYKVVKRYFHRLWKEDNWPDKCILMWTIILQLMTIKSNVIKITIINWMFNHKTIQSRLKHMHDIESLNCYQWQRSWIFQWPPRKVWRYRRGEDVIRSRNWENDIKYNDQKDKGQREKQWSPKHYTLKWILNNTNNKWNLFCKELWNVKSLSPIIPYILLWL